MQALKKIKLKEIKGLTYPKKKGKTWHNTLKKLIQVVQLMCRRAKFRQNIINSTYGCVRRKVAYMAWRSALCSWLLGS
jgi:hypothetical protein